MDKLKGFKINKLSMCDNNKDLRTSYFGSDATFTMTI